LVEVLTVFRTAGFNVATRRVWPRIQWWSCLCCVITLAVQVPFLDQPFYAGPLVSSLGGADIRARQGLPAADPVAS
jgi:hypothetical protein